MSIVVPINTDAKAIGAILGCMCGDVLGACVEGWPAEKIRAAFPKGLRDFQDHSRGFGKYTDDTQMTLALAQSIIDAGRVDPMYTARLYAAFFDMARGYGGMTINVLCHLRQTQGFDWQTAASRYIPGLGSFGNGAAMRISPVGIAYRNAPLDVLHRAVRNACVPTHTHPVAIDGAFVMAAAIGWLIHRTPAVTYVEKRTLQHDLLDYLTGIAHTEDMRGKLQLLARRLVYMPEPIASWETYLTSPAWQKECALQLELAEGNPFQIKADSAVAVALSAFLHHGTQSCPHAHNAFVAACHYGGDTDTIAAMAGACWGALHGYEELPKHWLRDLENGKMGRFDAIQIGYHLAKLDIKEDTFNQMECD